MRPINPEFRRQPNAAQKKTKNWLESYIELTEDTEAPELFHFWTGVSTIASALQNKCYIENPRFKWVPNFYIILVRATRGGQEIHYDRSRPGHRGKGLSHQDRTRRR